MQTIGQQLKSAREAKGASVSEAAQATRIKTQQLEAMEEDDFSSIPAAAYVRGFIKLYAQFLGLDPAPLLDLYSAGNKPVAESAPLASVLTRASEPEPEAGETKATPPEAGVKEGAEMTAAPISEQMVLPGEEAAKPPAEPKTPRKKARPAINWKQVLGIGGTAVGVLVLAVVASRCGRTNGDDVEALTPPVSAEPGLIAEPEDAYLSPLQ